MLKALQWHTGDQLNIAGQAEGTSTPSKVTVAFQLSPMKSADALKGWRTEFALVCLSNPIPSRCPDRNSISWQDMCVMYQPANLLTQQGDARGVPETSFTPPLWDLYLQPIGPNAFKVSRSWSLFTEKSGRFVTFFCSLWHDWAAVEHEYNMLESKFKGRYSVVVTVLHTAQLTHTWSHSNFTKVLSELFCSLSSTWLTLAIEHACLCLPLGWNRIISTPSHV